MSERPLVLLTGPTSALAPWQAAGWSVAALPLIEIRPSRHPLSQTGSELAECPARMFVSAAAVQHFFAARPPTAAAPWQAWATGSGTALALRQAGLPARQIVSPPADAPQFDSEALWACVEGSLQAASPVAIVRGSDEQGKLAGRDWLAQQLQQRGVPVRFVAAYERHLPHWTEAQRALAQRAAEGQPAPVWVFSSSEAVANLQRLLPDQGWQQARAVATHPRIAANVRRAGFGLVCESRPPLEALMASIESMA